MNERLLRRHCEERSNLCGGQSGTGVFVEIKMRLTAHHKAFCSLICTRKDCFVPRNDDVAKVLAATLLHRRNSPHLWASYPRLNEEFYGAINFFRKNDEFGTGFPLPSWSSILNWAWVYPNSLAFKR